MCSLFPLQIMKTTRANLAVVSDLFTDSKFKDLKIVLIVRDPRAVMNARSQVKWCQESTYCKVWQYGLWIFEMGDTIIQRFLSKNQTNSKEIDEF